MLHFQGGLKRLQDDAQRLSLVLLTSELTSVEDAASAAAAGLRLPGAAQAHSFKSGDVHPSGSSARTGGTAPDPQAAAGVGAWISRHAGSLGRLESSLVQRHATLGWSGATMWLFTVCARHRAQCVMAGAAQRSRQAPLECSHQGPRCVDLPDSTPPPVLPCRHACARAPLSSAGLSRTSTLPTTVSSSLGQSWQAKRCLPPASASWCWAAATCWCLLQVSASAVAASFTPGPDGCCHARLCCL